MKKTEEKIIRFIEQNKLIKNGEKILIAFSGGPDSVFALHFFKKFQKKYKVEISAIHFNHQLRGKESKLDEEFSKQFCEKLNVEYFHKKLNVKKLAAEKKLSIEEAARKLRYESLEKLCKEKSFDKIITAHNLSDNTETVLMNLLSGTSVSGLSGIPVVRGKIIRPILCITKTEILEYLNSVRISFRVDSSNQLDNFKRNFLRNRILPLLRMKLNPVLDEAIYRTTSNLITNNSFAEKTVKYIEKCFSSKKENGFELNLKIKNYFDEIPGELLKYLLKLHFNVEFKHDDYLKINQLAKNQKGKKLNLPEGITVYKEKEILSFQKTSETENKEVAFRVGEKVELFGKKVMIEQAELERNLTRKKNYELISADNLDENFTLRIWKKGDRFTPIGFNGTKKVSDLLTDCKTSSSQKKEQLVLVNRNKIIWVVGLRISDEVKITNKTKRVYKLWMN